MSLRSLQMKAADQAAETAAAPKAQDIQFKLAVKGEPVSKQVQMLQPAAPLPVVQRQEEGDSGGGGHQKDVHALAREGTEGGGGALPHGDKIQASFGRHDISGVKAHMGGKASRASQAMGAAAYTTGDAVAFADGSPSLHLAAHEAAHVIQQRAGVTLSGGVGERGDAYEQHADKVADTVVAGGSAQDLLDDMAGSEGDSDSVQMKDEGKSTVEKLREALDGWGADASEIHSLIKQATPAEKQKVLQDAGIMSKLKSKLSREERLQTLNLLNAPLTTKLKAAMDGWGADAATIKSLTRGASPADKKAVLADKALVNRLGSELSRQDMLEVLASTGAPLKMQLNTAMDGWGADEVTIKRLTQNASAKQKKALLADKALVQRLSSELSRQGMLEVLANVNAPLKLRLKAAMDGWGTDEATIETLTKNASAKEKKAVLADKALVKRLASELSRKEMLSILENINAPLKLRLTTAMDGWGAEGDLIADMVKKATAAQQKKVADSKKLFNRIADEVSGQHLHDVCDALWPSTNKLAALKRIFLARFGVKVGSQGDQDAKDWLNPKTEVPVGLNGIRRLYELFKRLPATHVKELTHILITNNAKAGAASGAASDTYFRLAYGESHTGDTESGAYTDGAADFTYGLNVLDTTTAHELAHLVDGGNKYSGQADFRKISGWKEYDKDQDKIAKDIESYVAAPLPSGLKDPEKKAARKAARHAIKNRRDIVADMDVDVDQAYTDEGMNHAGDGTKYRSAADLHNVLKTKDLFKHIAAGHADNQPWKTEPYGYLASRQIHESYSWDGWWSYDNSARATKFSWYQFRTPGEEFSEVYATYHLTNPKGSKVPANFKTWFEKQGLHTGEGTAGSSGKGHRHDHDHHHDH